MNRREFMKQATGSMAALGGGLYWVCADQAGASVAAQDALRRWGHPWRPDSPRRLSQLTHALAQRAIGGEHGRGMARTEFSIDGDAVTGMSPDMRYAAACMLVAEKAPLRVLSGERIIGSATLIEAAAHSTPVANVSSVSHTTLGFDRVLKEGYQGIRSRIEARLARGGFEDAAQGEGLVPGRTPKSRAIRSGACWWEAAGKSAYDTPPLSVECWAKVNSKQGFNVLVLNRTKESRHHWEIYSYVGSGHFSAYLPGYTPAETVSNRDITDGQWHHLAMAFTGNRVRLYVDGEEVANQEVTPSEGLGDGGGPLYFGAYPPGNIGCDGAIEQVRISKIAKDFSGTPPVEFGLDDAVIGLWHAGPETPAGVLPDASPLRNQAALIASRGGEDLLHAMLVCLDAAAVWHARHMALIEECIAASNGDERENYIRVREALRHVPERPASNFHEAVQSLWFAYAFQRLMGTWSGIGRIDEMLGPYLKKDLQEGRLTLDEAREILAHFWVKGCEWIGAFDTRGSGDAQHYQNIVLSGIDAQGRDVTNEVTWLVLDIVEELHISDFPIAVRANKHTPAPLFKRIAEVQRHGGGIVAIYNEDVVINGLVQFGYPLEEARCFANDGCWEVIIPGKTTFSYMPFDALALLHQTLGVADATKAAPAYPRFEDLYGAFLQNLRKQVEHHHNVADNWSRGGHPTPLVSMLVDDCIDRGKSYFDRGSHYTVLAPHAGRLANVANSLLVLKRLVYEEGSISLPDFVAVLRNDWQGEESLRRMILNRFEFYGNDADEADAMIHQVFDDYTAIAAETRARNGVLRPAGISTFGREIEWSHQETQRKASADGHHEGAVLATNFSPSPGTDKKGPTAVIRSYCKMDYRKSPNGATLELKIHPESVKGDAGRDAIAALMRTFVDLGGWFLHVDVVDSAMLIDAQRHPEKYPNLSVRIAGWSARFATLNKDWQDMVIARTQQLV